MNDLSGLFGDGINAGGPHAGHSDFYGNGNFDFTKEDHGATNPFLQPWRHFRDLEDVEKDLSDAITDCDHDKFESLMHQGQDYFSHYNEGWRWYWGGHIWMNTVPDMNYKAWQEANKWTTNWVDKWNANNGK